MIDQDFLNDEEPETTEETGGQDDPSPISLDEVLARVKEMTAQRDKLNTAISAHKKMAQKLIGRM